MTRRVQPVHRLGIINLEINSKANRGIGYLGAVAIADFEIGDHVISRAA
jgi:hypothetical protein